MDLNGFSTEEALIFSKILQHLSRSDTVPIIHEVAHYQIVFNLSELLTEFSLEYNDKNLALDKIVVKLMKQQLVNKSRNDRLLLTNIFTAIELNQSSLSLLINQGCIPELIRIMQSYSQQNIRDFLCLSSSVAIRLFQLLSCFESQIYEVEELKSLLGLSGCYVRYSSFKSDVIVKTIGEINRHTSFIVEFKEVYSGRKVVQLEFIITKK